MTRGIANPVSAGSSPGRLANIESSYVWDIAKKLNYRLIELKVSYIFQIRTIWKFIFVLHELNRKKIILHGSALKYHWSDEIWLSLNGADTVPVLDQPLANIKSSGTSGTLRKKPA